MDTLFDCFVSSCCCIWTRFSLSFNADSSTSRLCSPYVTNDYEKERLVQPLLFLFFHPSLSFCHSITYNKSIRMGYLLAAIYLLFTFIVAFYGISRFLTRGFIHFEEFSIDIALVFLSIGGMWYFAHITNIDTGFSPIITWLTAIHFHYAAFLLPIFVGLLGRIYKPKFYPLAAGILLISLMLLAIGITFSVWIEWVSVVFYMIGIYMMIFITWRAPFAHRLQKGLILLSFGSLGVTILFSFLYAFGRLSNYFSVSINFMLQFHGFLNCVLFALIGLIGWSISVPPVKTKKWAFPISQIRGNMVIGEKILPEIKDAPLRDHIKV